MIAPVRVTIDLPPTGGAFAHCIVDPVWLPQLQPLRKQQMWLATLWYCDIVLFALIFAYLLAAVYKQISRYRMSSENFWLSTPSLWRRVYRKCQICVSRSKAALCAYGCCRRRKRLHLPEDDIVTMPESELDSHADYEDSIHLEAGKAHSESAPEQLIPIDSGHERDSSQISWQDDSLRTSEAHEFTDADLEGTVERPVKQMSSSTGSLRSISAKLTKANEPPTRGRSVKR